MNVLIDVTKILGVGNIDYQPTGTQEIKTIPDSDFSGQRKSEIYWNGNTIANKTSAMLLSDSENKAGLEELGKADKKLPRGAEELIDVLISKGVIAENDLTKELKAIYLGKKTSRGKLK